ncbi:MAG: dienelactone hydrolase family protein [Bryobacteraceae bacterium]|nr:dienelactone hydrolase family protein [Bryobacteraceae bacterium]
MSVNRREFLVTKLSAGFALAVQPITAFTITTDTSGIEAGEIKIPASDGEIPAYRAMPTKGSKFATVLVVQEIFGVHEHIKDICRRLAKLGYMAVAPELYARQGDVSNMEMQAIIKEIVPKVPDSQVMADLDVTAEWAAKNGGDANRLAITGFCWGGRIVWLYAAHNSNLKAGAAWYGRLSGESSDTTPTFPLDIAGSLKAPVLGLYGGKDTGIPLDQAEKMKEALKAAGNKSMMQIYQEAPHGFHADYRPSYRESDAKDAWQRMLIWFKKQKVG